jgi:Ca2+-binding EF-hand superfamily protein
MSKICWALALCFVTSATALAQAPRGRDADAEFGEEAPRGERRERGERNFGRDGEEGGRFGRGGPDGEEGGRGGFRGGFGMRRPNPMFTALDADGDGSISKAELRKAAVALAKLDADGDGTITQEEANGPGGPGGPGGMMGMGDPAQMVDMAMRADVNGDGKITADEIPDARMRMMMQNSDLDGDGAITREELTASMEQMRQRMMGAGGFGGPGGARGGFGRGGDEVTGRIMSLDKNGDGKITRDEATEEARPMLRQADTDGNGEVDARELAEYARRMGSRARGALGGQGQAGPRDRFNQDGESASERRPGRGRASDDN